MSDTDWKKKPVTIKKINYKIKNLHRELKIRKRGYFRVLKYIDQFHT